MQVKMGQNILRSDLYTFFNFNALSISTALPEPDLIRIDGMKSQLVRQYQITFQLNKTSLCKKEVIECRLTVINPKMAEQFRHFVFSFVQTVGTMLNLKEIFSVSLILFSVIDVIGSIPFIITIKKREGRIHAEKATLISAGLMIGFCIWVIY